MRHLSRSFKGWRWWAGGLFLAGFILALLHTLIAPPLERYFPAHSVKSPVAGLPKGPTQAVIRGDHPFLLFRNTELGEAYGKLAFSALDKPDSIPTLADMRCDRVHFAAGRGVCLTARRGIFTTYEAIIFDSAFQPLYTLSLRGVPSRVRVSPDGRMAATTVFVSGHSYGTAGFSTHTSIIDLQTGAFIAPDLEKFTVWRDGQSFQAIDFNFWGVTFGHVPSRFYATLGSGGQTYLIEGDTEKQTVWVRRSDLECPALSPDNTKLAFKKRLDNAWGPIVWRLAIFDLTTQQEWLLAETRNIDDQAEWLDTAFVLYTLPDQTARSAAMHTWTVPADGSGTPRMFRAFAYSSAMVHPWPTYRILPLTISQ